MKWRALILPGILILFTCVFVVGFKTYKKVKAKKESKEKMAMLPGLNLVALDSLPFSLPYQKKPTTLIFFNPDCEHCQNEAAGIEEHREEFSNSTMLWVSSSTLSSIQSFSEKYKLSALPNFHFTKIQPDKVFETFGSLTIPHIFIYNEDQKLVKEFKGEVKVEAIIPFLK